jgi:hypothetical protein
MSVLEQIYKKREQFIKDTGRYPMHCLYAPSLHFKLLSELEEQSPYLTENKEVYVFGMKAVMEKDLPTDEIWVTDLDPNIVCFHFSLKSEWKQ